MLANNVYLSLLIVMCGLLFYFGGHFCFSILPSRLKNSVFDSARKLTGIAFLIVASTIFGFFIFDKESIPAAYSISINLYCYYVVSELFALSFLSLLANRPFKTLYVFKGRVVSWFAFPIPLLLSVLLGSERTIYTIQVISATFLFVVIILDVVYILSLYEKSKKNDNDNKNIVQVNSQWIVKSIYLMVATGVMSCVIAFAAYYPKWVLVVYLLYVIGVFVYIFEKYNSIVVIMFESLMEINDSNVQIMSEIANKKTLLPSLVRKSIASNIVKWLENKEYFNKYLTVQHAASDLGTNRSYLSIYINTTYDCSFKMWVSKLRIEDAKHILLEEKGVSITSVAERVGFQSLSSFTHTFSNLEGMPPRKWLEINIRNVAEEINVYSEQGF